MALKWFVVSVALLAGLVLAGTVDAQGPIQAAAATKPAIVPASVQS